MDARSEIEKKLNVSVGQKGIRKPFLEAIRAKGVDVHPNFVAQLREGKRSGVKTLRRIESSEVTDASKKDLFYSNLCQVALDARTHNQDRLRAHLFKSDGYLETIAQSQKLPFWIVELLVRSMRTDMALAQAASLNIELDESFRRVAETYLSAKHDVPPSKRFPQFSSLDENWDHRTMVSFYQNLYKNLNHRSIGTWVPYEMEALSLFYTQQLATGSPLTPFDTSVLEFHKGKSDVPGERYKDAQLAQQIRQNTGIEVNYQVIERQRNLLSYGVPTHTP